MDELCDFPGIYNYNVSNGFTVIWFLASLDCPLVTNSFSYQTASQISISSCALLEPSLPSCVEREETLNTPLWGGLADTDVQRDLFHRGSKHSSSSRGECQHSGPGRSGEGRKEPKAYHLRTHRQPRRSTPTTPCPTTKS